MKRSRHAARVLDSLDTELAICLALLPRRTTDARAQGHREALQHVAVFLRDARTMPVPPGLPAPAKPLAHMTPKETDAYYAERRRLRELEGTPVVIGETEMEWP